MNIFDSLGIHFVLLSKQLIKFIIELLIFPSLYVVIIADFNNEKTIDLFAYLYNISILESDSIKKTLSKLIH
jgi:hypothetical protein